MAEPKVEDLTLADKLYRTKYETDAHSHIETIDEICRVCKNRVCLKICPAEVYKTDPNDPQRIAVSHENCLECGTCRKACPYEGIRWAYPDGGRGVKYRFG
ncbi:MAG: 4Fe-4S dicluster domain-containing protein [Kiritimatiellia bacterium]|nr:4Fe-4S dicluster domain-containing protein [Kiritimatiellia bacterium]